MPQQLCYLSLSMYHRPPRPGVRRTPTVYGTHTPLYRSIRWILKPHQYHPGGPQNHVNRTKEVTTTVVILGAPVPSEPDGPTHAQYCELFIVTVYTAPIGKIGRCFETSPPKWPSDFPSTPFVTHPGHPGGPNSAHKACSGRTAAGSSAGRSH